MVGIVLEKYHAMEHEYPSKVKILKQYGYDPKALHHLLRVENFIERYINGEKYEDCLNPGPLRQELLEVKAGKYSLEKARELAVAAVNHAREMEETFCNVISNQEDVEAVELLEDVQFQIIKLAIRMEVV
jgi:hypothetical protein